MSVFLDHLAATLVGTTVVVVLAAIVLGGRSEAVQQARYDIHREQARMLSTILEDDLRNAGAGVPPSQSALVEASDGAISFRVKEGFGNSPVRTVRYQRVGTGTVAVGSSSVPAYAIERTVDGDLRQRVEGLTELAFELRDADGAPTADLARGRAVHVRFAIGAPSADPTGIDPRARYRRAVQMPNLRTD